MLEFIFPCTYTVGHVVLCFDASNVGFAPDVAYVGECLYVLFMIQNTEPFARLYAVQSGERSINPVSSSLSVPANAHKLF